MCSKVSRGSYDSHMSDQLVLVSAIVAVEKVIYKRSLVPYLPLRNLHKLFVCFAFLPVSVIT